MPVFDGVVDIRHDGRRGASVAVRSGGSLVWKAVVEGRWKELTVNGVARRALQGEDESGRSVSWVMVKLAAGEKAVVAAGGSGTPLISR